MESYNIYLLLIIEVTFLIYSYRRFHDVLAPSFVSFLSITFATVACLLMSDKWKVIISYDTISIVFVGLLSMLLANLVNYRSVSRNIFVSKRRYVKTTSAHIFTIVLIVILTVLYIKEIRDTGATLGLSLIQAISVIKEADDIEINFIVKQGQKVIFASGYIFLYIYINNQLTGNYRGRNIINLIPPICLVICCVFAGVRTDILKIFSAALFLTIFLSRKYNISLQKYKRKALIFSVFIVFLGGLSNTLIKGDKQAINDSYSPVQIVAYYFGSSVSVLNYKIEDGIEKYRDKKIWGKTTFSRQYATLEQWHIPIYIIPEEDYGSVFVLLDPESDVVANVDTILGAPLIDFGIFGMFIYIYTIFYFLSFFYYRVVIKNNEIKNADFVVLLYSFIFVIPIMAYYGNLFNLLFTTPYFIQIFILLLMYKFLIKNYIRTIRHESFS